MEKEILITEEIANHELNADLGLEVGGTMQRGDMPEECPLDNDKGYYIKSGGKCVFVPYS